MCVCCQSWTETLMLFIVMCYDQSRLQFASYFLINFWQQKPVTGGPVDEKRIAASDNGIYIIGLVVRGQQTRFVTTLPTIHRQHLCTYRVNILKGSCTLMTWHCTHGLCGQWVVKIFKVLSSLLGPRRRPRYLQCPSIFVMDLRERRAGQAEETKGDRV